MYNLLKYMQIIYLAIFLINFLKMKYELFSFNFVLFCCYPQEAAQNHSGKNV